MRSRALMDLVTTRARPAESVALFFFGALVPTCALLAAPRKTLDETMMAICCLSTAILALCLWLARARIRQLEAKEAAVIGHVGFDPLSGLRNRLYFEHVLDEAVTESSFEAPIALIAIDIDKFKTVNDTHGHPAGDKLIVEVAKRIQRVTRDSDCLARLGGDEFAIVVSNIGDAACCAALAQQIQDAMRAPFDVGQAQIFATLSIGIALSPQDGATHGTLSHAADLALYRAKNEGRNRFAFFDKTMEQELHLGQTLADDLRVAIAEDALTLLYQPLIDISGTKMSGLEALVRWPHPRLGMIPPETFIPLAESRGLIGPLGEWVLRRACQEARRWPTLRIAVNVSPVQFRQRDFVKTVKDIIDANGIDASRLDLELTEGVLIQDADQAEMIIMDLRALGIRMGLDDFGSGYSSMIYLRRFAFDKIKIDRAFLQSMESSGEGAIIVESIVSLGHALGLTVTAEGVEQKEQVDFLQKLGCDEMQGFYFAPPLSPDDVDARLSLESWQEQAPSLAAPDRSAA